MIKFIPRTRVTNLKDLTLHSSKIRQLPFRKLCFDSRFFLKCHMTMVDQNFIRDHQTWTTWYWILANESLYNLLSDICGEDYDLDSQGLTSSGELGVSISWTTRTSVSRVLLNPSNAEATFFKSTTMQKWMENHLKPVMLVFIGKPSLSALRWVPIY